MDCSVWPQILSAVSVIVAVVGLVALLREYRKSNAIKRANFVTQLIEKYKGDIDIRKVMYMFQYNEFIYDERFHCGDDNERQVDKALFYLSYACYLKDHRVISNNEYPFFEIEVQQALRNNGIIDYLYNLYHFECKATGLDPMERKSERRFTFYYLLKYARENRMIDESFYDPHSAGLGYYSRYLNF